MKLSNFKLLTRNLIPENKKAKRGKFETLLGEFQARKEPGSDGLIRNTLQAATGLKKDVHLNLGDEDKNSDRMALFYQEKLEAKEKRERDVLSRNYLAFSRENQIVHMLGYEDRDDLFYHFFQHSPAKQLEFNRMVFKAGHYFTSDPILETTQKESNIGHFDVMIQTLRTMLNRRALAPFTYLGRERRLFASPIRPNTFQFHKSLPVQFDPEQVYTVSTWPRLAMRRFVVRRRRRMRRRSKYFPTLRRRPGYLPYAFREESGKILRFANRYLWVRRFLGNAAPRPVSLLRFSPSLLRPDLFFPQQPRRDSRRMRDYNALVKAPPHFRYHLRVVCAKLFSRGLQVAMPLLDMAFRIAQATVGVFRYDAVKFGAMKALGLAQRKHSQLRMLTYGINRLAPGLEDQFTTPLTSWISEDSPFYELWHHFGLHEPREVAAFEDGEPETLEGEPSLILFNLLVQRTGSLLHRNGGSRILSSTRSAPLMSVVSPAGKSVNRLLGGPNFRRISRLKLQSATRWKRVSRRLVPQSTLARTKLLLGEQLKVVDKDYRCPWPRTKMLRKKPKPRGRRRWAAILRRRLTSRRRRIGLRRYSRKQRLRRRRFSHRILRADRLDFFN